MEFCIVYLRLLKLICDLFENKVEVKFGFEKYAMKKKCYEIICYEKMCHEISYAMKKNIAMICPSVLNEIFLQKVKNVYSLYLFCLPLA